ACMPLCWDSTVGMPACGRRTCGKRFKPNTAKREQVSSTVRPSRKPVTSGRLRHFWEVSPELRHSPAKEPQRRGATREQRRRHRKEGGQGHGAGEAGRHGIAFF